MIHNVASAVKGGTTNSSAKPAHGPPHSSSHAPLPKNSTQEAGRPAPSAAFERRRSSVTADQIPSTGRRASVDIFEGLPIGGIRRASINPLAPKLDEPTIRQVEDANGDYIVLECRIHSDVQPEANWYHLDDLIKKNDQRRSVSMRKDGNGWIAAVEIRKITPKDAGKYTCRAKNANGENFATVFSYVEAP
ncbi:hypothetical protein RvY_07179 [Ramazzottius varieornatus]|uniref:Ig-like domain-containing protein n=1 Tax=Ramazzottius varieornatus TaxID=947166 RepID=A0A1D1V1G1_RAMVA|nr:hypothetical protein RvY_07179 [Ramazzottius varieornatus]